MVKSSGPDGWEHMQTWNSPRTGSLRAFGAVVTGRLAHLVAVVPHRARNTQCLFCSLMRHRNFGKRQTFEYSNFEKRLNAKSFALFVTPWAVSFHHATASSDLKGPTFERCLQPQPHAASINIDHFFLNWQRKQEAGSNVHG